MTSIQPVEEPIVALKALREPIEAFTPRHSSDRAFKAAMLELAEELEDLWSCGEDDTLEANVLWTALYAFSALTAPGPDPEDLVEQALAGAAPKAGGWGLVMTAEAADTLRALAAVRGMLRALKPPGYAAALWRATLLALYGMIELFVIIDDAGNADRCLQLLDTAEAMADRFAGKA